MTKLLRKDSKYEWSHECEQAFYELKESFTEAPILASPNWDREFHVHVDASGFAIGAVLCQAYDKGFDHPIYYASRQISAAEKKYNTTEREALGMIFAVQKFCHYLLANPFVFYVDHQALKYLIIKPCLTARITRRLLILQEFQFRVVPKLDKSHLLANHTSRIPHDGSKDRVDDEFPDAMLFTVDAVPEWYFGIAEYTTCEISTM